MAEPIIGRKEEIMLLEHIKKLEKKTVDTLLIDYYFNKFLSDALRL